MRTYIGIYGNIQLPKGYCPRCKMSAFIIDGKLQCCAKPSGSSPKRFKRESQPAHHRKPVPRKIKRELLKMQDHRCFYCEREFETCVYRGNKVFRLRIDWDHMVPFAYSQNNYPWNYVAACHVCNRLKSSLCFRSIDEAKVYLANRWKEKGYSDMPPEKFLDKGTPIPGEYHAVNYASRP